MLSVAFDTNHDISVAVFDFIDVESPINMDEALILFGKLLEEHVSLVFDFVSEYELLIAGMHMRVEQRSAIQSNPVRFPEQLGVLQEEEEFDDNFHWVFGFKLTHFTPNIEIISSSSFDALFQHTFPHLISVLSPLANIGFLFFGLMHWSVLL